MAREKSETVFRAVTVRIPVDLYDEYKEVLAKKGAIVTAKESLALSIKAGNGDYEKMNKDSIAEWSK